MLAPLTLSDYGLELGFKDNGQQGARLDAITAPTVTSDRPPRLTTHTFADQLGDAPGWMLPADARLPLLVRLGHEARPGSACSSARAARAWSRLPRPRRPTGCGCTAPSRTAPSSPTAGSAGLRGGHRGRDRAVGRVRAGAGLQRLASLPYLVLGRGTLAVAKAGESYSENPGQGPIETVSFDVPGLRAPLLERRMLEGVGLPQAELDRYFGGLDQPLVQGGVYEPPAVVLCMSSPGSRGAWARPRR